jgi:hypothetical protein
MSSRVFLASAIGLFAVACSDHPTPSQPSASGPSASPAATSSVTVPRPVAPAAGVVVRNADQPVTLIAGNAVITGGASGAYTFEVAADAGFASKVYAKSGVSEGSGGQTSLTIDRLGAGTDYYWHARAEGGGTTGPFSAPVKFTIGPAVTLGPPTPVSPANGTISIGWPTFTVNNSARTGPVAGVAYRFEIATNATFTPVAIAANVVETTNQTSFTPPSTQTVAPQTVLFWRATALDVVNAVSSPASEVRNFTYSNPTRQSLLAAQQGLTLWPGVQPPGTNGKAAMGGNWDVQTVRSFDGVTFVSPTLEELQVFDLIDRGFDPDAAIVWMRSNGYPTAAAYYPSVAVIGFPYEYMALVAGKWDLVIRVGA